MATELFIHKMSEHMETGTIVRWLVREGDVVERYQVLMEVETDKVIAELESPASGVLKGVRPGTEEGAVVPVGETIAYIAGPDEEVPRLPRWVAAPDVPSGHGASQTPPVLEVATADSVRATPVARRVAKELGVNLESVRGSGPNGRIREEDVRAYADAGVARGARANEAEAGGLPLTRAQFVTGQRMLESVRNIPQFELGVTVDMSRSLSYRESVTSDVITATGERPSVTALLVTVVAKALRDHPRANASFVDGSLQTHPEVNIGVAIGTEQGLVVPVIRQADGKSLAEIVRELTIFQRRASDMRFGADDLTDGTFTISNLGMVGIERFTAIINPPQSAILAVGRIAKTTIVTSDDAIAVRPVMALTLTVDHRVLDGIQAARFLVAIRDGLENLGRL